MSETSKDEQAEAAKLNLMQAALEKELSTPEGERTFMGRVEEMSDQLSLILILIFFLILILILFGLLFDHGVTT